MSKAERSAALTTESQLIMARVDSIVVQTPEDVENATEVVKSIKAYKKNVHEFWDEICDNAYKSWKASTSRRKEFLDPADAAETGIKFKISRYYEAEREQQAKEHAKRVEAEEKAAAAKRVAEVEEMRGMGALEEADHIATQPLDVRPVAPPAETKVKGLSMSERWHAEVVNLGDFLSFLAGEPRWQYLIKDFPTKELNKLAVAQKEMFDIPGVEAVKEITSAVRS